MTETNPNAIESILNEARVFPPLAEFAASAHIKSFEEYEKIYAEAAENPEKFWEGAAESLHWFKNGRAFDGTRKRTHTLNGCRGTLNVSYNCIDRHWKRIEKTKQLLSGKQKRAKRARLHINSFTLKFVNSPMF
jgi:acetyl-CoA synthetase